MHRCCLFASLLAFVILFLCERGSARFIPDEEGGTTKAPSRKCSTWNRYFDEAKGKCRKCSSCETGYGVKDFCGGAKDTVCEKCETGKTFSYRQPTSISPCYRCTDCGDRALVTPCSPTADTVCGDCPLGKYWDTIVYECRPCSLCMKGGAGARRKMGLVKACMKSRIPSSHWCISSHYSSPRPRHALKSKVLANGTTVFFTSSDEAKRTATKVHAEESETIADESSGDDGPWSDDEDGDVIIDHDVVVESEILEHGKLVPHTFEAVIHEGTDCFEYRWTRTLLYCVLLALGCITMATAGAYFISRWVCRRGAGKRGSREYRQLSPAHGRSSCDKSPIVRAKPKRSR